MSNTLVIDIGASRIKMIVLNEHKNFLTNCIIENTPSSRDIHETLALINQMMNSFDIPIHQIAVGFPGMIEQGIIHTAPNMGSSWLGINLEKQMQQQTGLPTLIANDADLLGYGLIRGVGVELVIILGTGMGSSLFVGGRLVPNLELAHHPFQSDFTYEELLGKNAFNKNGKDYWNQNLLAAISLWKKIFNFKTLYLSGGFSNTITCEMPHYVEIKEYTKGLIGGVILWQQNKITSFES